MAKVPRVVVLSFLACAVVALAPSIAQAQPAQIVYQGIVNNQTYCIWGIPQFDPTASQASATVSTEGNCTVYSPRALSPITSGEVSVYPIAWYWDDNASSWYQCQVGTERKVGMVWTTTKTISVPSCPRQHWISVWAHVAARPVNNSTWHGGDVYGDPVWYP